MRLLKRMPCRSVPGEQLLASCIIFKADLEASAAKVNVKTDELTQKTYQAYLEAQAIILLQVGWLDGWLADGLVSWFAGLLVG